MSKKTKIVYCAISSELVTRKEIVLINQASKFGEVIAGVLTDKVIAEY